MRIESVIQKTMSGSQVILSALVLFTKILVSNGVWTTDCRLLATQRLDPISMKIKK